MIQKIAEGVDWSLWTDWYELYSGVLWMGLIGIAGHFFIAPMYSKLESWIGRRSFLLSALILFVVIFVAYQFNRLGSLPFYYLQF
jgi:hypothetical protein